MIECVESPRADLGINLPVTEADYCQWPDPEQQEPRKIKQVQGGSFV